jgi:hypothetical protein
MPTRRGSTNRKTGKTTPRSKPTTHWSKGSSKRVATSKKAGKPAVASKK